MSDKSHLSEWIGEREGSTTKSNFWEQDNTGSIVPIDVGDSTCHSKQQAELFKYR